MITRISHSLASQIVETVHDICGQDINFIDPAGKIFVSTDPVRVGTYHKIGYDAAKTGQTIEVTDNTTYPGARMGVNIPVSHNGLIIAVIGITGPPDEVRRYAHLAEQITRLLIREQALNQTNRTEEEKMNYVINSLIHEETFDHDYMLSTLSSLGMCTDAPVRVIALRLNPRYNVTNLSMIEHDIHLLFASAEVHLFSYRFPNEYIAVITDEVFAAKAPLLEKFAGRNKSLLTLAVSGTSSLYRLSLAYQSAQNTLKSALLSGTGYALYDTLTLEILMGNTSETVRKDYCQKTIQQLTEADKNILRTYYEQGMSLSKTSKLLFLHKNTLQYRLNHIHEITGFNPRSFKDAVILYLALYVEHTGK